jgi:hypothetical protein
MWIAVVAVAVVAVGAVVAKVTWRPNADETHSVRNYQSAVGTMEHLAERRGQSTVRVLGGADQSGQPTGSPSVHIRGRAGDPAVPPVPVRGSDEFPDPDVPLVFDDADPTGRVRRFGGEGTSDGFRSERARRQALQSMNHRPRRWVVTTVVVVVLAAFGALAVVGSRRSPHHSSTPSTATTGSSRSTAPGRVSTTVPHRRGTTPPPRTTTTTTPKQLTAASSTAGTAVYAIASTPYQVTVSAIGECWVGATNRSTGATVWTGTLAAGASQTIVGTGPMSVELGATSVSLTVNGVPVVLPNPIQSPFDAVFEPVAPTAATTTTTSTTSTSSTTVP